MSFQNSLQDGKIGEQLYIDYAKSINCNIIDVRNDKQCQLLDIDFIRLYENHTKEEVLDNIQNGNPEKKIQRQKEIGYAVEVKLDKATHNRKLLNGKITYGTGNIVYEVISHNMPGCTARTYADFVLYICVDTFEPVTKLVKAYMINMYNLRKAMTESKELKNKMIFKQMTYVQENNISTKEDILNILIPVEEITKINNIITDYTNKLINFFPQNLHMTK